MAPLQSFVWERPLMSRIGIFPVIPARRSTMPRFVHLATAANPVETVTDNIPPLTRIAVSGPPHKSRRSIAAGVSCLFALLAISSLLFFSVAALAQSDVGTIVGF